MAKRSTIGENPLDAVIQENPLDTVVPDLSAVTRGGRGQPAPEMPPEVQARLQELEAGLKALRTEVAGLKAVAGEAASLKGTIAGLPGELAGLRREVDQLKAEAAAVKALQAEVTQLKDELARLRASAGPGRPPLLDAGQEEIGDPGPGASGGAPWPGRWISGMPPGLARRLFERSWRQPVSGLEAGGSAVHWPPLLGRRTLGSFLMNRVPPVRSEPIERPPVQAASGRNCRQIGRAPEDGDILLP